MTTLTALSRRSILRGALLGGALAAFPFGLLPKGKAASLPDSFGVGRQQWLEHLLGKDLNTSDPSITSQLASIGSAARSAMNTYVTSASRTGLWSDLSLAARATNADSARVTTTARRLRSIALAWAAGALGPDADRGLATVADGLAWLSRDVFSTGGVRYGNWYDWDVSAPQALNDALVLTFGAIPASTRTALLDAERHFTPVIPQTGTTAAAANRVLFCDSFCGRGLLGENADELTAARDGLAPVLTYAQPYGGPVGLVDGNKDEAAFFSNDGFYPDGSFIQHGQFPYIGGYGASYLTSITAIAARTSGMSWCPDLGIVHGWIHSSFEPWLWRGLVMDTVRGRQLATVAGDQGTGLSFINGMLDLLPSASDAERSRLKSLIKAELPWRGTQPTAGLGLPETALALEILGDPTVVARSPLNGTWVFGPMDRVLHRRDDWAVAFAMNSLRMADYENGSNENLRGWYTSDAATFLYTGDLDQFDDAYWCTVNAYRIPGTTVDTVARDATATPWRAEYHNPSLMAGGLSAQTWGVATIDLTAKAPSTLHGRFSRFFFDDCYVCAGAGISVSSGRSAETIVENRRVTATSSGPLTIEGSVPLALGESKTVDNAGWAHIGGVAGYVMLGRPTVLALHEQRSGRLSDISGTITGTTASTVHTGDYVVLALQHGPRATDASYAYIVAPGLDAAATAQLAAKLSVRLLGNTPGVQAVRHEPAGRLGAAFYEAGTASVITVDAACVIAVEETDSSITVRASDPTQSLSRIRAELRIHADTVIESDPRVSWAPGADSCTLTFDVSGLTGSTVSARLAWQPPSAADLAAALGRLIGRDIPGSVGAQLQKTAGHFIGVFNSGDFAAARTELHTFQTTLDDWVSTQARPTAGVLALVDLASRLVTRTLNNRS
ncbi:MULTISPECIES: polysaccharide lyase 8 family protein [Arthrobacter]|nr:MULTISPECIES: polysaccharide lyase 8 family protein [Arthrobacter]MBT8162419.1 polysaccharide lyase 8 family protein [Arthrobacter sp. GN70]